ncbi:MAG: hypothetical protein H0W99_15445 [Acidobacteria bacterium]|nr:hypothetical protein [Acidobacteriota bacterium]
MSGAQPFLNPRLIGINGQLSTIAVPLEPGRTYKVYVGGDGLDQVSGAGISITSPYMSVDSSSMVLQQLGTPYPIISFNIKVAEDVPAGDYDLRFQSNNGEISYIAGGLTVDDEGSALLLLPSADSEASAEADVNPATVGFNGTGEDAGATIIDPYLSGESFAPGNHHAARRIALPGGARAGAFTRIPPTAEERLKALVEPLLNAPDYLLRIGPS